MDPRSLEAGANFGCEVLGVSRPPFLRKPVTDIGLWLTSVIQHLTGKKNTEERSKVSSNYEQSVLSHRAGIQALSTERHLSDASGVRANYAELFKYLVTHIAQAA
jgi:hypothetical protein